MEKSGSIVSLGDKTRELYKIYDLSLHEKEVVNDNYINELIKSQLGSFSDKWFVEYSVLATTIDPLRAIGDTGNLRCFSFIQDNNAVDDKGLTFKDKIETYISPIISVLKEKADNNNWWFHNPETFLAPTQIDPYISFTNEQPIDSDIVRKIEDLAKEDCGKYEKNGNSFYYSSMEYARSFIDILSFSKNIYNANIDQSNTNLIKHYHHGVEEAREYYDYFIANFGETYCYLTFPIIASPARFVTPDIYKKTFGDDFLHDRYQGIGHCFIYFNIKEPANYKIEVLNENIKSLFNSINNALHNFAFNYTFNLGLLLQEKAKKEAEKSAKAAIMSRNMSHNLGSHVMAYLKQHLSSVTNIIQDNILSNLITTKELDDLNSIYRGGNHSTINDEKELFVRLILRIINEVCISDEVVKLFVDKVFSNEPAGVLKIADEMKVNKNDLTEIIKNKPELFIINGNDDHDMTVSINHSSGNANLNDSELKRKIQKYLKEELIKRKTNEKTKDKESATSLVKKLTKFTKTGDDVSLPFLVGMGDFLSYLQERQDFIATIATDYIPYFSPINFKDFIYDELNPDKRFERHKDRRNLQPDNILLGNIARSEGLGREIQTTSKRSGQLSDIVLNFRDYNGNVFDGAPVVNSSNSTIAGREKACMALETMRELEVSLPGGVIGRQAFFSIVENIIRNAAKHGNWRNQGKLELTFEFIDKKKIEDFALLKKRETTLLQIKEKEGKLNETEQSEYDEIIKTLAEWNKDAATVGTSYPWQAKGREKHLSLMEVLWLFYSQALDVEDLFFVTITDNINISEESVKKLRDALTEDYIDNKSQKMNEGNKGIKEIRISAAWLRGAKDESEYFFFPNDDKEPQTGEKAPLVYIRQHYGCLQYIICLQKPRNIAIITQEPLSQKAIDALKIMNWRYYSEEDFKKERNQSYRFILCENRDLYYSIRPFSSSHLFTTNHDDFWEKIKEGLSEDDAKKFELYLYQSLVEDTPTIWIDDDKAKGALLSKMYEDENYKAEHEENGCYKIKDVEIRVIDGCHTHVDYIYRKHHDTLEQFTSFMKENPNGCKFVESITGDNSTDRLIRNEKYGYRWYYAHLNAMKKKVAIFDERLFSRIYGLEEADFTKGNAADLQEMKEKYCEIKPLLRRSINDCKTFDELNTLVKEKNLPAIEGSKSTIFTKDYIALTYYQKGICFYTLVKDPIKESETKVSFGIYGLFFDGEDCSLPQCDDKYSCRCERVATFTWANQKLNVDFEEPSKKHVENCFDFISIHQGLLDKLYEGFGIKYDREKKMLLTTEFCKQFRNDQTESNYDWKHGFVPGLIVHSGRSKPTENDMPQMLPFIQYASIEHAVLDCKFSLIDLLENARYEQ